VATLLAVVVVSIGVEVEAEVPLALGGKPQVGEGSVVEGQDEEPPPPFLLFLSLFPLPPSLLVLFPFSFCSILFFFYVYGDLFLCCFHARHEFSMT
jgi:hypothetical protein